MYKQPTLFDISPSFGVGLPTHKKENNNESQKNLEKNKSKFSKKCYEFLVRLCNGERLQFANEVKTIGDLRRRSLDLIELDGGTVENPTIPVQRTFKGSVKEYWLREEDINWVKERYLK